MVYISENDMMKYRAFIIEPKEAHDGKRFWLCREKIILKDQYRSSVFLTTLIFGSWLKSLKLTDV